MGSKILGTSDNIFLLVMSPSCLLISLTSIEISSESNSYRRPKTGQFCFPRNNLVSLRSESNGVPNL